MSYGCGPLSSPPPNHRPRPVGDWLISSPRYLNEGERGDILAQVTRGAPGRPVVMPHDVRIERMPVQEWTCEYCQGCHGMAVAVCPGCGAGR